MTMLHSGKNILIFDIEHNGPKKGEAGKKSLDIIEVAMMLIENFDGSEIVTTYNEFVRPTQPIQASITKLTGITNEMVMNKYPFRAIAPQIQRLINKADILVIHGGKSDTAALRYNGIDIEGKHIFDTATMAASLLAVERTNLKFMANYFDINQIPTHRAIDDVYTTHELYKCLTNTDDEMWHDLKKNKRAMAIGYTYTYQL